jgi:hypothetical protein
MSLDPRSWGVVGYAALALLVLVRVPNVVAYGDPVTIAGGLAGVVVGSVLLVGVGRWLVLTARSRWGTAEQPQ